jgi:predicted Zn finger-like uncharacterized protein
MVILCPGCKNQITLDDATIPAGVFKVRCTGCGKSITTQKREEPQAAQPQQQQQPPSKPSMNTAQTTTDKIKVPTIPTESGRIPPELQSFVNSQISAAKQEILNAIQTLLGGSIGKLTASEETFIASNAALICSGDPVSTETLLRSLKSMGYEIQSCKTAGESLKKVDEAYELIIIDPTFTDDLEGAKKLIGRINSKKALDRRKVFVVLLSSTQKSLDGNSAFMGGVNLIVNKADVNNLETYIRQGQKHFQKLYSTFEISS